MNPVAWIFQFTFGCRHRHLSRVFTIKQRTYRVCFDCAREFDLPNSSAAYGMALAARLRTPDSSHVSYLAQTRKSVPVILQSPECVERATTANS
jgi:hypothetical protein